MEYKDDDKRPTSEEEEPAVYSGLEEEHPADTADRLENLGFEDQARLIAAMQSREAAESVAEMERHEQKALLSQLNAEVAAALVSEMSPDDAADALLDMDDALAKRILRLLDRETAARLRRLLKYEQDTAGGVMNTQIVILDEKLNADQAIRLIRQEIEDKEVPYYAYLVDENDRLTGVLSMRDLLMSQPGALLMDLIKSQVLVAVTFDVDREEVAHLIRRYNFLAIPVVDYEDRLVGVVTHDDVMDIIHEEATEDMQKLVGAGSDETVDSPWTYSLGKRLPWLLVNMLNSAVSAWVVHFFEGSIAQMAVLAVLMPMVANQAGNTGQQALAVVIRQMAVENLDRKKAYFALFRELKIGLVNGLLVSMFVLGAVFLITAKVQLAAVMAIALFLDMLVGSLAGAGIPVILKELGRDPAQASSIFLTTLTDSLGFFFFLGLAQLFLLS
ncbi:magnesium transporter [Desulfohalovibrio reitneri]|uniref:magnesium transporter n=1 Tax=Desulfohalovibrio reitneri TaxID=1307759 RepID=UPI0004A755B4|nr:magnesium transporter [Desulfohalovibrio reitneri]